MSKNKKQKHKQPQVELKNQLEQEIYNTLKYRSIFKYPMTLWQLSTFLISPKGYSHNEIKEAINSLFRKDLIDFKNNGYHLARAQTVNWQVKYKESAILKEKALGVSRVLSNIPWVKMICITGSVAAFNASKSDDIDFFIVTEKNRVWITRLLVVLILKLSGLYRTDADAAEKICPNLFIDETCSEWSKDQRNIYVAHEIALMHPIFYRDNAYFDFLKANSWVKDFFDMPAIHSETKPKFRPISKIGDFFEFLARSLQILYMSKGKTTEITKSGIIHFNKNDWSKKILKEFN